MIKMLRKKPNLSNGFRLIHAWDNVQDSNLDKEARELFLDNKKDKYCNLELIAEKESKRMLLAFLRYDYKKILVRTRYLYIDRNWDNSSSQLKGGDLDFGFFEPILLCFPNLEFIGRINFPEEYKLEDNPNNNNTTEILEKMLKKIGNGYEEHSSDLVTWHRHSLSHELRPEKKWNYDLNTGNKYESPQQQDNNHLYLNVPHFIDVCILEIEKICDELISRNADETMSKFKEYMRKKNLKKRIRCKA